MMTDRVNSVSRLPVAWDQCDDQGQNEAAGPMVPNSSGSAPPKLEAPANACDCHMHIYDGARFPPARPESRMQANAAVADYRLLQRRIGTRRTVVVSPAAYGI